MPSSSTLVPTRWELPIIFTVTDTVYTAATNAHTRLSNDYIDYDDMNPWMVQMHHLLPLFGFLASIGVLALCSGLFWLAYRFAHAGVRQQQQQHHHHHRLLDIEEKAHYAAFPGQRLRASTTAPAITHTTRQGHPGWFEQMFGREFHSQRSAENAQHTSSTSFVPFKMSPLRLVSRQEIWNDPIRRRGIDELAMWEYKKSARRVYQFGQDYPDTPPTASLADLAGSPPSPRETRQQAPVASSSRTLPRTAFRCPPETADPVPSHIAMARQALEASRLENSSSQWLSSMSRSRSF